MRQGEIWYADLNPAIGSEQSGLRPVVVVSGNLLNEHLSIVIVMPLTSSVKKYKGNPVLIPSTGNGLTAPSEILVFHVRSVSKNRLVRKLGSVEKPDLDLALKTLHDVLTF